MANNIIRVSKPERFTVLSHEMLRDKRLTFGARGLLAYLLSLPDNWEVRVSHLIEQSPAGRDAIYTIMRELTALGYMVRTEIRGADGRISGYETIVRELPDNPQTQDEKPQQKRKSSAGIPDTEKPYAAKPDTVRHPPKKELVKERPRSNERPRETPAPDSFEITTPLREWVMKKGYGWLDLETETESFLNHFKGTGKKHVNWEATWRNWMINSATKYAPRHRTQAEMNRGGGGFVF